MRLPPTATALALMCALLLTGCGIAFGELPEANDFFVSLEVTGEKTAGSPLTAAVAYETFYPSAVDIVCELRRGKETLREIGRGQAPEVPNRRPDDVGVPGNFSIDFTVDTPGDYKVECFTALDEANFIIEKFTIKAE